MQPVSLQHTVGHTLRQALRALTQRNAMPGFADLSWRHRQQLNGRALLRFAGTPLFWRLALWTAVAWLLAANLVWRLDLQPAVAEWLWCLPLVWLLPGCARGRRLLINRLLGPHWPSD